MTFKSLPLTSFSFALIFSFLINSQANAYENELVPYNPDRMIYEVMPYIWYPEIEGDVASVTKTSIAEVGSDGSDMDFTAAVAFNGYGETQSFFLDWAHINMDTPVTGAGITGNVDIRANILTVNGGYALTNSVRSRLDVMYGIRAYDVDAAFGVTVAPSVNRTSHGDREFFVDPMIGLRGQVNFWKRVHWTGSVNVGGLKAIGSDFSWEVFNGFGFRFSKRIMLKAGYRHLEVDFDRNGLLYDVEHSGPWAGLNIGLGDLE